jgi:hypothetical protein
MIAELARSERKVRDLFGAEGACDLLSPCRLDTCRHFADLPKLLIMKRTSAAPELIGIGGLVRDGSGEVELLCWIARPYRGLGYGTEAARAIIEIAALGLRLSQLCVPKQLERLRKFPERLGFHSGQLELPPAAVPKQVQAQAA